MTESNEPPPSGSGAGLAASRGSRRRPATHGRPCACRVADLHHKLAPHPLQHADEGGRPLERGAFRLAAGAVAIRLQRPLLLDFMFRAAAEMASHDSTGWGQDAVDGRKTSGRAVATAASAMEWEGGRLAGFGRERRCGWMGREESVARTRKEIGMDVTSLLLPYKLLTKNHSDQQSLVE